VTLGGLLGCHLSAHGRISTQCWGGRSYRASASVHGSTVIVLPLCRDDVCGSRRRYTSFCVTPPRSHRGYQVSPRRCDMPHGPNTVANAGKQVVAVLNTAFASAKAMLARLVDAGRKRLRRR
jgi:hypothetical protein